jgi:hypothetical protein
MFKNFVLLMCLIIVSGNGFFVRANEPEKRFSLGDNGVITDHKTGLQWLEGPDKPCSWEKAQEWIQNLGEGWRTPTLKELKEIYLPESQRKGLHGDPLCIDPVFKRESAYSLWSVARNQETAWIFDFSRGYAHWIDPIFAGYYDRAVAIRKPEKLTKRTAPDYRLEWLGHVQIRRPAFLSLHKNDAGKPELLVTSFQVFGRDRIFRIPNLNDNIDKPSALRPEIFVEHKSIVWPNEIEPVPDEVFGPNHWLVAGGFLVPGKDKGRISILNCGKSGQSARNHIGLSEESCVIHHQNDIRHLTEERGGWWYHRVKWLDMDGDDDLDLLGARARKGMFGKDGAELFWLENDNEDFKEHIIYEGGADVNFELADLNNNGQQEIIATEFFGRKLSLYYKEPGEKNFKRRIIDSEIGSAFDLSLIDLNGDGRLNILVTNHEADEKAAVFAYEIPADPIHDEYKRHILMAGFKTLQPGIGSASPGKALAFHPMPGSKNGKPWIIVSGDGAQKAYLLTPFSDDINDWGYKSAEIYDAKCTVGQIAVGDVNGDGSMEIFIPAYDRDSVEIFRLYVNNLN